MFLEYWMIFVLFIFLYFALSSMYFSGYASGFRDGGLHGYLGAIQEIQRKVIEQENTEEK